MKIAIDIDGVILDSERSLKFYADYWSYFNLKKDRIREDDVTQENCFDWTNEEIDYFYNTYFDTITDNSNLIVGAKEILTKLHQEGHELYIVTLRGYYREQECIGAENKLKQLGDIFKQIYWNTKDKISVCKQLGIQVMIDDNPDNVEQFADNNIQVLYFKEQPIRDVKLDNVTKVDSWMDIYREIKNLSSHN